MEYFKQLQAKLKETGIEESKVNELIEFSKKSVPKEFVPSVELTKVKDEYAAFKETVAEKDELIENLKTKAESVEEYESKVNELTNKMSEIESTYNQKLQAKTLENKINEKISSMNDLNPKAKPAFKKLLDRDKISLDGDNLIGFDEQAANIKEQNDYMIIKKQNNSDEPPEGQSSVADEKMARMRNVMGLK